MKRRPRVICRLIDEVSLLVAPVADGRARTPTVFDIADGGVPRRLALEGVERLADDIVLLRYRVLTTLRR